MLRLLEACEGLAIAFETSDSPNTVSTLANVEFSGKTMQRYYYLASRSLARFMTSKRARRYSVEKRVQHLLVSTLVERVVF